MNYSFEYIDIILLAMIAGFIFLRLRGILGKRTGFEGKNNPQFKEVLKKINKIDKVFYSHMHADQTHGINDLRVFYMLKKKPIPVYADNPTKKYLLDNFKYCFKNNNKEYEQKDLNTLLSQSDIISIHCALNESTKNLLISLIDNKPLKVGSQIGRQGSKGVNDVK